MTKKSKTDLTSQVNSLLPDNIVGDISPTDVRVNFTDGIDSFAAIDTNEDESIPPLKQKAMGTSDLILNLRL